MRQNKPETHKTVAQKYTLGNLATNTSCSTDMPAKGKEFRVHKWSNVELQQFAEVLVDEDDSF